MNHKGGINPVNPMWSEKYRPESLDDIVGQEHIVERLRFVVERLHQDGDDAGFPAHDVCRSCWNWKDIGGSGSDEVDVSVKIGKPISSS